VGRRRILAALLMVGLVLSACGDDEGGGGASSPSTLAGDDGTVEGTTGDGDGGEVPDPCTLVDASVLNDALGSDPGSGTVQGPVPDVRKVCLYPTGLILAVEDAANYEVSVDLIREDPLGATISDVDGVGLEAIWQDFGGGLGQLVARGDAYFVGVSVPAEGQAAAQAIAEAMLAAL